jgi:hypothetical protein
VWIETTEQSVKLVIEYHAPGLTSRAQAQLIRGNKGDLELYRS